MSLYRLLTDFDGRIGLRQFWLGSAIVALMLLAVRQAALHLAYPQYAPAIIAFAGAFALFPWAALAAKRAVDRGSTPLFGILLICAIVLPRHLHLVMPLAWDASLDTVSLMAWLVALVDLGMMPSVHGDDPALAEPNGGAKATPWTRSTSTPQTPSL